MTKITKNLFKIQPQSREIKCQIFIILRLKGVCTLGRPHAIFQSFLLEMLDFIQSFTTSNFNPNYRAIAI